MRRLLSEDGRVWVSVAKLARLQAVAQQSIGTSEGTAGMEWGAPDHMDTRIVECSMKPEVRFGYREEAAADLLT